MSNKNVVDVFPSTSEIIQNDSSMFSSCEVCGKQFQNTSACRLHRVKVHKLFDKNNVADSRIHDRSEGESITYLYHCPNNVCLTKKSAFDGMRNLKQHYWRAHMEKRFSCSCGFRSALEKDVKYHMKSRCRLRSSQGK
ncbi:unnamed protein product [Caenorhabditis angaria]|uniref:C2H2-type domain-containing protein n=1 Tax=Caenorhabditis angaria TaxID=860376 RepID=A0A9P1IP38_9PELO|nr:unnamed protein product [Caenorhabditis angaria]